MNKYNLIYLKSHKTILSKKAYSDWKEIETDYEDYFRSLSFDSLMEVEQYLQMEFNLSAEKVKMEVQKIIDCEEESVVIGV